MGKVVLVADDDEDVREIVETALADAGYDVVAVADGAAALEAITSRLVDALVTDIMMPKMNGFELAAKLRALGFQLPIVFVSGYSNKEDVHRHGQAFLRKPFRVRELAQVVERLLPA